MNTHIAFTGFLGKRLHLGISGSIAAYKGLDLLRMFKDSGADVGVTLTDSAQKFITALSFEALGASPVFTSMYPVGDDVFGHLMPGEACHAFVIAPASATTLARLANGLADDMLSCQALAFPEKLVVAPAMNPRMWHNSVTQENVDKLRSRGHVIVEPGCGRTACMEEGKGRLAPVEDIYLHGLRALAPQDLAGKSVMITLGPTREKWDGVRFWSNPSSGTMGASFAIAAWLRGAEVHAICGPGAPWLPAAINRYDATSAADMYAAAQSLWDTKDIGIFTAAVADYTPVPYGDAKFKKGGDDLTVSFTRTVDILKTLGTAKRDDQRVIGFAAETDNIHENVKKKLAAKNADMVVGNNVGKSGSGFASATNEVCIVDRNGRQEDWPVAPKPEVAWRVLDWLLQL